MKEHKMKNKSCLYILTEFVSSLNGISLHNKIEIMLRAVVITQSAQEARASSS